MSSRPERHILVIDDNQAIHEDFRKILEPNDADTASLQRQETLLFGEMPPVTQQLCFKVDCASQGEEGLEMIRQARRNGQPYAVAFVDTRMPPGWDGVETIAEICKEDPAIQLVLCSAYSDYSAGDILSRFGITDRLLALRKPCDCSEVLMLATTLSEKWRLTEAPVRLHQQAGPQLVESMEGTACD